MMLVFWFVIYYVNSAPVSHSTNLKTPMYREQAALLEQTENVWKKMSPEMETYSIYREGQKYINQNTVFVFSSLSWVIIFDEAQDSPQVLIICVLLFFFY